MESYWEWNKENFDWHFDSQKKIEDVKYVGRFVSDKLESAVQEVVDSLTGYATHVMGQEIFGRAEVIRLIQDGADVTASREEAMRVFGQVLNDGQIEKIRRGQFRLTTRSPYYRR